MLYHVALTPCFLQYFELAGKVLEDSVLINVTEMVWGSVCVCERILESVCNSFARMLGTVCV